MILAPSDVSVVPDELLAIVFGSLDHGEKCNVAKEYSVGITADVCVNTRHPNLFDRFGLAVLGFAQEHRSKEGLRSLSMDKMLTAASTWSSRGIGC